MKFNFDYRGKRIELDVKNCNRLGRFLGLMFRSRKTKALLFDFGKNSKIPLHSFFVFFPFIVVWLDSKNNVVGIRRVKPWNLFVMPKNNFSKIVEIPINEEYKNIVKKLLLT